MCHSRALGVSLPSGECLCPLCLAASVVVLFDWFATVTILPAILSYWGSYLEARKRRMDEEKKVQLNRTNTGGSASSIKTGTSASSIENKAEANEADEEFSADRLQDVIVGEMYAMLLGTPLLKWLMLLSSCGVLALCSYGASQVKMGYEVRVLCSHQ